jgi:hypothetical protein
MFDETGISTDVKDAPVFIWHCIEAIAGRNIMENQQRKRCREDVSAWYLWLILRP